MVHAIIHTITLNTSGTAGKCIEGREFIIALPESFVEYKADDVVRLFTDSFHKRYDVECSAALHHNKKMTNYHIHLVFSERKMLEHPEVKIATRNMFYDEQGKHRRTKKEILDEQGSIAASLIQVMPFSLLMTPLLIVFLAIGILVGAFGGAMAIRNYLKV